MAGPGDQLEVGVGEPGDQPAARWRTSSAFPAPGYELALDERFPEGSVSLVEVPALTISSSDCRARVAREAPIWYPVPDPVVRYIDKRHLYRD